MCNQLHALVALTQHTLNTKDPKLAETKTVSILDNHNKSDKLWFRHLVVFVKRYLLSLSEQTQHFELYAFIFYLRHVSAFCFSHHQVESQDKWQSKGCLEYFSTYVTVTSPYNGRNMSIHPFMALQPLPGLGLPHKTPPFISIRSPSPPSSYPQQL